MASTLQLTQLCTPHPHRDLKISFFALRDPKQIPWGDAGADYVVEASGVFTAMDTVFS